MGKKIIIGIIAVLIVGLGGWKIYTDQVSSSEETKDAQVYNSEISAEKENDNIGNNKSKNKKSIYPNNDADKISSSDENNNKNESTENENKSDMEDQIFTIQSLIMKYHKLIQVKYHYHTKWEQQS